jgi:hypothetical protein
LTGSGVLGFSKGSITFIAIVFKSFFEEILINGKTGPVVSLREASRLSA